MGKVTHPKSFRLTTHALARLNAYCELSGLDASEVARAAIAQFIAPALQGVSIECVKTQMTQPEPVAQSKLPEGMQEWFKAFWAGVENKQFPKRVIKAIKDNWSDLKDFDPTELQEKYNRYCEAEQLADRYPCHPNSWIANGGYENDNKKQNTGGIAWDAE